MRHGSLFNGIGGFQLAAEWIGWENVMSCEIDKFCNRVTKYYWPNCVQHEDIRETDFTVYKGRIDIISGGFPCQPYSIAGQRKGKNDNRHLWPEMLRAIREIQPRWVVGENVYGIINWNGGLVFDEVQAEMEASGYEVWSYVLPACSVNAEHKRERVWFVAHSNSSAIEEKIRQKREKHSKEREEIWNKYNTVHRQYIRNNGQTQPFILDGNDGLSTRLAGITFSRLRSKGIEVIGNSIQPQVAYEIFKVINSIALQS